MGKDGGMILGQFKIYDVGEIIYRFRDKDLAVVII